jgi:hypothetical protein
MVCSRRFTFSTNLDPERIARIQGVLEGVKGFVQSSHRVIGLSGHLDFGFSIFDLRFSGAAPRCPSVVDNPQMPNINHK